MKLLGHRKSVFLLSRLCEIVFQSSCNSLHSDPQSVGVAVTPHLWTNCWRFRQSACAVLHSRQQWLRVPVFPLPHRHSFLPDVLIVAIPVVVTWYLSVVLIFLVRLFYLTFFYWRGVDTHGYISSGCTAAWSDSSARCAVLTPRVAPSCHRTTLSQYNAYIPFAVPFIPMTVPPTPCPPFCPSPHPLSLTSLNTQVPWRFSWKTVLKLENLSCRVSQSGFRWSYPAALLEVFLILCYPSTGKVGLGVCSLSSLKLNCQFLKLPHHISNADGPCGARGC